jgi:hypothetical protein
LRCNRRQGLRDSGRRVYAADSELATLRNELSRKRENLGLEKLAQRCDSKGLNAGFSLTNSRGVTTS